MKPENLVADSNGYIRITDFGVAKIFNPVNYKDTSGTPGYMAPEVLFGKNHSYSVDFYAIGIMGFEFIFGDRPYEGTSRKELREEIIKKQARIHSYNIPKGWSKEGIDFVNRLMQRKPDKRLGNTSGVKELKEHKWFNNFDWNALHNKTMNSPFIPPDVDNYDKEYCEEESEINVTTHERYEMYLGDKRFGKVFMGYTFINEESQKELYKKYEQLKNLQKINKKEIKIKLNNLQNSQNSNEDKVNFSNPSSNDNNKVLINNIYGNNASLHDKIRANILSENIKHKNSQKNKNKLLSFNSNNKNISQDVKNSINNSKIKKISKLKLNASQSMKNIVSNGFMTQKRKFNIDDLKLVHQRKDSGKKVFLNQPFNIKSNIYSPKIRSNLPKLSYNPSFINHNQVKYGNTKNIIRVNSPINLNIFQINMVGSRSTRNLMHSQSTRNISSHYQSKKH